MPGKPSPDAMVGIVRKLREEHPDVGVKKFVSLVKAAHPDLTFGAREVREALDSMQAGILPSEAKAARAAKRVEAAPHAAKVRGAPTAPKDSTRLNERGKAVLNTLRSAKDSDWQSVAQAIKTMKDMITQRGQIQRSQMRDFLAAGALTSLTEAMSLNVGAAQLQIQAYIAMTWLFDDASLVKHAAPTVSPDTVSQLCDVVIAGMVRHMQLSDVAFWGAAALQALVMCSQKLKVKLVQLDDVITVTLQVLDVHLRNERVQTKALNLLHFLIGEDMAGEHYLATRNHCNTALRLCRAFPSPYPGVSDAYGNNDTEVQQMADLLLQQLSKFKQPKRSLKVPRPGRQSAQRSVQQIAQHLQESEQSLHLPVLTIPAEAALRQAGEAEMRQALRATIEEDRRMFELRRCATLTDEFVELQTEWNDIWQWLAETKAYSPMLLLRCVKSLSDDDAQQIATADVTCAHRMLLRAKAANYITKIVPPAGTGNATVSEGLDWLNVFKPKSPTRDQMNFRRTWRSVVAERLQNCGVPADRYTVFYNQIVLFASDEEHHTNDVMQVLKSLSREPVVRVDSENSNIGCGAISIEGFAVGSGSIQEMSEDQIIEDSHLPPHQNMRNTAINVQYFLQMNENRCWDSEAKQYLLERINEHPTLFSQRAQKTWNGDQREPDIAQQQDAEHTAQLNMTYFKDVVEKAFHSVGPLDQRKVESFALANIGLSQEAFRRKCEQFVPDIKRSHSRSLPDDLSFTHASTKAKESQKPGHARELLGGYGQKEIAETRQAFADPTNQPRTGYTPGTVAEGRSYVARMQFLLKEAWSYHEQGWTREWIEMTADEQKVHLRASNYCIPDSPDKPIVKLGHGGQEDMTDFCRYFPDLTVSKLLGGGMISLIRRYAQMPLSKVMATDEEHMQGMGSGGLMRTTFIYQILLGQVTWYYDHFLTHNNVDVQQLLVYGPDKCTHLGERMMRHRALLELEASDAARAKRQANFDAKFGPSVKAARVVEVHSPVPKQVDQPEMQTCQNEREQQQRQQDELDRRRSAVVEEEFAKIRICPKGITSFKKLVAVVTPLGWSEKVGGHGGHHIFERAFITAGGGEVKQSVTVASSTSDSKRAWKNVVNDFNKQTRQQLELRLP